MIKKINVGIILIILIFTTSCKEEAKVETLQDQVVEDLPKQEELTPYKEVNSPQIEKKQNALIEVVDLKRIGKKFIQNFNDIKTAEKIAFRALKKDDQPTFLENIKKIRPELFGPTDFLTYSILYNKDWAIPAILGQIKNLPSEVTLGLDIIKNYKDVPKINHSTLACSVGKPELVKLFSKYNLKLNQLIDFSLEFDPETHYFSIKKVKDQENYSSCFIKLSENFSTLDSSLKNLFLKTVQISSSFKDIQKIGFHLFDTFLKNPSLKEDSNFLETVHTIFEKLDITTKKKISILFMKNYISNTLDLNDEINKKYFYWFMPFLNTDSHSSILSHAFEVNDEILKNDYMKVFSDKKIYYNAIIATHQRYVSEMDLFVIKNETNAPEEMLKSFDPTPLRNHYNTPVRFDETIYPNEFIRPHFNPMGMPLLPTAFNRREKTDLENDLDYIKMIQPYSWYNFDLFLKEYPKWNLTKKEKGELFLEAANSLDEGLIWLLLEFKDFGSNNSILYDAIDFLTDRYNRYKSPPQNFGSLEVLDLINNLRANKEIEGPNLNLLRTVRLIKKISFAKKVNLSFTPFSEGVEDDLPTNNLVLVKPYDPNHKEIVGYYDPKDDNSYFKITNENISQIERDIDFSILFKHQGYEVSLLAKTILMDNPRVFKYALETYGTSILTHDLLKFLIKNDVKYLKILLSIDRKAAIIKNLNLLGAIYLENKNLNINDWSSLRNYWGENFSIYSPWQPWWTGPSPLSVQTITNLLEMAKKENASEHIKLLEAELDKF